MCDRNGMPAQATAWAAQAAPTYPGCSVMLAEVQEWAARHPVTSIPGTALHLARLACEIGSYPIAASVGVTYAQAMLALARLADAHGVRLTEVVASEMRRIDGEAETGRAKP